MEGENERLHSVLDDGLSSDLLDAGRFCFSCEQIFSDRISLEEHVCSAASYICSCGTEFTQYSDMLEHSTKHEPGHQVLDHQTIKKRRFEKRIEEQEKLQRLQTGEVVWGSVPSVPLPVKPLPLIPTTSAHVRVPIKTLQISQVPELPPSVSQASLVPNSVTPSKDMQNIFAGVGAPTVDLWTLYQPVVLLRTVPTLNKKKPYICGKCAQCFATKACLISHHNLHVTDKVSGCIGCGLLLSSKKVVPRFHVCNSPNNATKFRLVTAKPLNYGKPNNKASTGRIQDMSAQEPQVTSSVQLKRQNPTSVVSKGMSTTRITSILKLKNQNIRSHSKVSQGIHGTPSVQIYSRKVSTPKPCTASLLSKSLTPNPSTTTKSGRGLSFDPSLQLKTPTNSPPGMLNKPVSQAKIGFICRVCHIAFESAQLLQRHKCIKAQEFMAQQLRGGKQHNRLKRVTPIVSPVSIQMNERIVDDPAAGNMKKNQVVALSLDRSQGGGPVNGKPAVKLDDDCYIVESGPGKPAEVIYQVTSSVPITT